MSPMDLERYNADWLQAWTDKDVERLAAFYTADTVYMDPQTTGGIAGRTALKNYLTKLFGSTPAMVYTPDTVWGIDGGFCGRWYCDIGPNGKEGRIRGFDLCLLEGGLIAHNEVYVHPLQGGA